MISILKKIAATLQDHLKSQGYTSSKLMDLNYLFVLKLVDWKQEHFTVYEVIEESDSNIDFTIKARNNFLSYSNCKLILTKMLKNKFMILDTATFVIGKSLKHLELIIKILISLKKG